MKKARVFNNVAKLQNNIVMSGKTGESILTSIMDLSAGKGSAPLKK
jgi:hypothetical protein